MPLIKGTKEIKRAIVFGGDGRAMSVKGLDPTKTKVRYLPDTSGGVKSAVASMKGGGVDAVFGLTRFVSHKHEAKIVGVARRVGIPYIRSGPVRAGKTTDTKPKVKPVAAPAVKTPTRRTRKGFDAKAATWPQSKDFTSQRAWIISLLGTDRTLNSAEVQAIAAVQGVWKPPVEPDVGLVRASALIQWWRRRMGYDMYRYKAGGTPPGGLPANYLPPEFEHLREVLEG
jgi:hypothetical protein